MKNLKLLFAVFVVTIATLFVYSCAKEGDKQSTSLANSSPGESCLDKEINMSGCIPVAPNPMFEITNVPGYRGCTFKVEVEVCLETSSGNVLITAGNYKLLDYSCGQFDDSISYFLATPSENDDNAFINRFDQLIFARLENYLFASYGGNIQCGYPVTFTLAFIRSACSSICFYQYEQNPKDGDGSRFIKVNNFVRSDCSSTGCCRRETTICYNPATDMLEKKTNTTMFPLGITPQEACAGGNITPPILPSGTFLVKCNACAFSCQ